MLSGEDITKVFLESAEDNSEFKEAIRIIKDNGDGNHWLIGGFVYRNIASSLYGVEKPKVDMDFIIENPKENIKFPSEWKKHLNKYGNPKFIKNNGSEIDFIPLEKVHSIIRRGLTPSIENFLTGTPLTIQSIVFDVQNNQILGDIGIKAILEKTVGINDIKQVKIYAEKKNKSIGDIIKEKADQLGFKSVL